MAVFISQENVNVPSAEILSPISLQVACDNTQPCTTSCFMTSNMLFANTLFAVRISLYSFCSAIIIRFGSLLTRYSIIAVQCFNSQRSALYFLRHLFHSLPKSYLNLHNSFLAFARCISSTPSCSTRNSLRFRFLHIACYANNIPERGSLIRTNVASRWYRFPKQRSKLGIIIYKLKNFNYGLQTDN